MNDLSTYLPPDLESWIETRVAEGRYFDAGDYLRDLIRRDRAEIRAQKQDTAWVREMIAEGLASGVMEREASAVLRDIMTEIPAGRG